MTYVVVFPAEILVSLFDPVVLVALGPMVLLALGPMVLLGLGPMVLTCVGPGGPELRKHFSSLLLYKEVVISTQDFGILNTNKSSSVFHTELGNNGQYVKVSAWSCNAVLLIYKLLKWSPDNYQMLFSIAFP